MASIYDFGFDKNLRRTPKEESKDTNKMVDYGFGGTKMGKFIRIEKGSIIIKDELGYDRVIIGKLQ